MEGRKEIMENSYRFFENKSCQYYPCHKGLEQINCMFCYCPLYPHAECPGNYKIIQSGEKKIKDCSHCNFPHRAENYDKIMECLR